MYFIRDALLLITVLMSLTAFASTEFMEAFIGNPYRIYKNKEWYRLLSSGFLHADLRHLVFNMVGFYFFGNSLLEALSELGFPGSLHHALFVFIYLGSILSANVVSYFLHREDPYYLALGASGGVSGILASCAFLDPRSKVEMWGWWGGTTVPITIYLLLFLLISFLLRRDSTGKVGHYAHFVGAVFGILITLCLKPEALGEFIDVVFSTS